MDTEEQAGQGRARLGPISFMHDGDGGKYVTTLCVADINVSKYTYNYQISIINYQLSIIIKVHCFEYA